MENIEDLTEEQAHYILGNEIASIANYLKDKRNGFNRRIDQYYNKRDEIKKKYDIVEPYDKIVNAITYAKADQISARSKQQHIHIEKYNKEIKEIEKKRNYGGGSLDFFD